MSIREENATGDQADSGPEDRDNSQRENADETVHRSEPDQDQPIGGPARPSSDADNSEHEYTVINNFYDKVLSGTIGVGQTLGAGMRRGSGRVAAEDIAQALRYYLPPPTFDQALTQLRSGHLVALIGPEGAGRAAGSLALAGEVAVCGSDLTRLPPSLSLTEISQYRGFKTGQAFLLHDWSPAVRDGAAWFDIDQLKAKLREKNAYLILTADAGSRAAAQLSGVAIEWSEPRPTALLRHCLKEMDISEIPADDLRLLEQRAEQLRWPRHVVRLAVLCLDGADVALTEMGDTERETIDEWRSQGPARSEVLSVAALAFLSGITERRYESLVASLVKVERIHRLGPQTGAVDGEHAAHGEFPQRRVAQLSEKALKAILVERDGTAPLGVAYRPAFRTGEQRRLVLCALHTHFGDDLWTPVSQWLSDIADEPFGEEHLAIGSGVALLAHCAMGEVEESYLELWAAGGIRRRLLATDVIWSMAADDLLAPRALRLAVSWVLDRGPERAMTAALCFGGLLGRRYPSEAIRRLWELSQRAERISRVARTALARLFAMEADAGDDDTDPGKCMVPRGVLSLVRPLLQPGVAVGRRRRGLTVVTAVLTARGTAQNTTAVACVARNRPDDVAVIGELWSMALHSVPHRADALDALRETLDALSQGSSAAETAARLGAEILPRLGQDAMHSLYSALATPRRSYGLSKAVISAFLQASGSVHGTQSARKQ